MLSRWDKFLFERVDNSALVLFRMLYGVILASEAFGSIVLGAVRDLFIKPHFTFTFIGFEFLEPLPGNGMYVLYSLMGLAGIFICIGFKYRWAMLFMQLHGPMSIYCKKVVTTTTATLSCCSTTSWYSYQHREQFL